MLSRFLEHTADDRLFALWRLAAVSGMRRGELAAVTWPALDLDGARLEISQQLVPTRGGVTFGPPKSVAFASQHCLGLGDGRRTP